MDFEGIARIWQCQTLESVRAENEKLLLLRVVRSHRTWSRWLTGLNVYAVVVGVPAWLWMVWQLFFAEAPGLNLVLVVQVVLIPVIIGLLTVSTLRQRARERSLGRSVREHTERLLSQNGHWRWLVRIYLWGIFPVQVLAWTGGVTWVSFAHETPDWFALYLIACSCLFAAIFAGVFLLYRRRLQPRAKELERLLCAVDE